MLQSHAIEQSVLHVEDNRLRAGRDRRLDERHAAQREPEGGKRLSAREPAP
jgi:hypothetical protein